MNVFEQLDNACILLAPCFYFGLIITVERIYSGIGRQQRQNLGRVGVGVCACVRAREYVRVRVYTSICRSIDRSARSSEGATTCCN